MPLNKISYLIMISILSGVSSFFFGDHELWATTFSLDNESVLCVYYKMSGKDMDEQDMEDLCFELGRPTFTAFKPSEMFMKHSLRRLMERLTAKMKDYGEDSLYSWGLKFTFRPNYKDKDVYSIIFDKTNLPQPTLYISSEISESGRRSVKRVLNTLVVKKFGTKKEREMDVILFLRPEKIDHRFQRRNVDGKM